MGRERLGSQALPITSAARSVGSGEGLVSPPSPWPGGSLVSRPPRCGGRTGGGEPASLLRIRRVECQEHRGAGGTPLGSGERWLGLEAGVALPPAACILYPGLPSPLKKCEQFLLHLHTDLTHPQVAPRFFLLKARVAGTQNTMAPALHQ